MTTVEIGTPEELVAFAARVNAGETTLDAKLMADIDLTGVSWFPVGDTNEHSYRGTFDGNGHTINNFGAELVYTNSSEINNSYGFFRHVMGATIKNTQFADIHITTKCTLGNTGNYACVSAIVADTTDSSDHSVSIDTCAIRGSIIDITPVSSGTTTINGIAKVHRAIIKNCIVDVDIISQHLPCRAISTVALAGDTAGTTRTLSVTDTYITGDINIPTIDRGYGGSGYAYSNSKCECIGLINLASVAALGFGNYSAILVAGYSSNVKISMTKCYQCAPSKYKAGKSNYNPTYPMTSVSTGGYLDGLTGGTITAAEYNSRDWWQNTAGYDFENTWYWDSTDNLPKLQVFRRGLPFRVKTTDGIKRTVKGFCKTGDGWKQATAAKTKTGEGWR